MVGLFELNNNFKGRHIWMVGLFELNNNYKGRHVGLETVQRGEETILKLVGMSFEGNLNPSLVLQRRDYLRSFLAHSSSPRTMDNLHTSQYECFIQAQTHCFGQCVHVKHVLDMDMF